MVKTMCNICGRSTVGIPSIYNKILGRVCGDCLNHIKENIVRQNQTLEAQAQMLALQSVIERDIEENPYGTYIFEAILDSLSRYQMTLIRYTKHKEYIKLAYRGEYRRANVIISIEANGRGVHVTVCKADRSNKVYVERSFGES